MACGRLMTRSIMNGRGVYAGDRGRSDNQPENTFAG